MKALDIRNNINVSTKEIRESDKALLAEARLGSSPAYARAVSSQKFVFFRGAGHDRKHYSLRIGRLVQEQLYPDIGNIVPGHLQPANILCLRKN